MVNRCLPLPRWCRLSAEKSMKKGMAVALKEC
jgi:hypothetical protein